jgi:signal transduction histidine kinase
MQSAVWPGERILVVEDDDDLRETVVSLLEGQGFRPVGAENGLRALEYLRSSPQPALILLDLMMPEMDGWQFRVEQKKDPALATIPVLVLSADDSPQAAAIDAHRYIPKPVDFERLLDGIRSTIRESQSKRHALAERMVSLGALAAGVAHEVNNPLAYVIGNLDYLVERSDQLFKPTALDEGRTMLSEIRDGVERIRGVMQQVSAFSTMQEQAPVAADLHQIIEGAIRMVYNQIRHRARLVREYGDAPRVQAVPSRIAQVFTNLLANAAHAIPEGHVDRHQVKIRTYLGDRGQAVVEVSDTGRGIPADVMGRIFEPFFTTKEPGRGTGLGLSICYGIVRTHGGQIAVTSTPGKGSCFRVELPAATATVDPRESGVQRVSAPTLPLRARILIVDDELPVARALARLLVHDHEVDVAVTGEQALELIEQSDYDLILCDLMMPTMSGIEVYESLSRKRPGYEKRIVFMTGGAFTDSAHEFMSRVPQLVLNKPINRSRLEEVISRQLDRGASLPPLRVAPQRG